MGITRVGTKEAERFEKGLDLEYHDASDEPLQTEPQLASVSIRTSGDLQRGCGSESLRECIELLNATVRNSPATLHSGAGCEKSTVPRQQRVQLEAERFEAERIAASTPVFADGPSTVRFATPVEEVTTVVDFHSPDMSLGASAGNVSLKTRTAGQTMVINARKR